MSLVQAVSKNLTVAGTTQTTNPIATTAKNCLAFCAAYNATNAGVVTPSDSTGLTWTLVSTYAGGATGLTLAVWVAKNITGNAANTFTFATTGNDTPTIIITEFSGRDLVVPFDLFLTASDTISASGSHTTGTIFARGGDDLLAFNVSSSVSQTYTPTGLWAIPPNGSVTGAGGYDAFVQYINSANNGNNANTYSVLVADKLDAFIITLKPPALPYSDEWLDYFNEVPEVYPHYNSYQQVDIQAQIAEVDQDWNDECGDNESWALVEDQSSVVVPDVTTNTTAQYYGDGAELADEAIDHAQFATTYQQADNTPPLGSSNLDEPFDWFQEIDDDEWVFRDTDVLGANVIATIAQPGEDIWEDEDPDDFFADDFGNDDADLPQNDPWDHWPTDEDDYAVEDSYIYLNNVGPSVLTVEDGWDQEHFGTEDADVQWTEDGYENDPNPLLSLEDGWQAAFDDFPDQNDEFWWIENETDYALIDNNPVIDIEDAWDHWLTDDDDYVVIDDYALQDANIVGFIAPEDAFDWYPNDPDDELFLALDTDPVGPTLVIQVSTPPEDPWDWTQAEDDYVTPDDYAIIDAVVNVQLPVDDAWNHFVTDDDDYIVTDDYVYVNNAPITVEDPTDWSQDADDEEWVFRDSDQVSVPQQAAIDDPWDWSQDADDELVFAQGLDPVTTPQPAAVEDAWDHFGTDPDDWALPDDYALVTAVVPPSQFTDEAWDWFYEPAEDNDMDFAVDSASLPTNVYVYDPNFEVYMPQRNWVAMWLPTGMGTI